MKYIAKSTYKHYNQFLLAYILYYCGIVVQITAAVHASIFKNVLTLISITFLVYIILSSGYAIKLRIKTLISILVFVLVIIVSILSRDAFVIVLMLFAVNANRLDDLKIDNLMRATIAINIIVVLVTVSLCAIGIIPNLSFARDYGTAPRPAFGFSHSQNIPLLYFYSVTYYYIVKRKIRISDFAIFEAIGIVLNILFDARNAFYSLELFFIVLFTYKIMFNISKKKIKKALFLISSFSIAIMSCLSFVLLYLYIHGNTIAIMIDKMLTRRVSLVLRSFTLESLNFISVMSFGEYKAALQSTLDNGYYYIAFRYGIIFLFLLCIVGGLLSKYFREKDNENGAVAVIVISISAAIANCFVGCYFFVFWIIAFFEIGKILNNKRRNKYNVVAGVYNSSNIQC